MTNNQPLTKKCKSCGEIAEVGYAFCDFCLEGEGLYAESFVPVETHMGDS